MLALEQATGALLARYDAATPEQKSRGRDWYAEARKACRAIARESGFSYRRVAAVLAITSPEMQLLGNIRATRAACLNGGKTAGRYPAAQVPKVRAALFGPRPSDAPSGPKVRAFYRAILGDADSLVVDRWASYAAGGPKDVPRAADRRVIEQAYREAARRCGETVRDFQAIVWIQCRESDAFDSRGRFRRYSDITRQEVLA